MAVDSQIPPNVLLGLKDKKSRGAFGDGGLRKRAVGVEGTFELNCRADPRLRCFKLGEGRIVLLLLVLRAFSFRLFLLSFPLYCIGCVIDFVNIVGKEICGSNGSCRRPAKCSRSRRRFWGAAAVAGAAVAADAAPTATPPTAPAGATATALAAAGGELEWVVGPSATFVRLPDEDGSCGTAASHPCAAPSLDSW